MNALLCSVLLPSRSRVERCLKCVQSFIEYAPGRTDFDVLIRLDNDEPYFDQYVEAFKGNPHAKLFFGERGIGYKGFSRYITDLASVTDARWIMQFNDDATISGPWLSEIEKVEEQNALIQPEWHQLGHSVYHEDWGGPFPTLPNKFWKQFGMDCVPDCADKDSINAAVDAGWPIRYMRGVAIHHHRDSNEELEVHRKL